jgi:hypothetical protein
MTVSGSKGAAKWLTALLAVAVLAGCVSQPRPRPAPLPPPPDPNVYIYPTQGQSPAQTDRDRYECNDWAVRQTGFDPSQPNQPPRQHVRVVAGPPPGSGVATGAITGAFIGAAVSDPWHAGPGALIGALAGAAIGGASDAARAEHTQRLEDSANNSSYSYAAQRSDQYKRALSACLEARGYQVR